MCAVCQDGSSDENDLFCDGCDLPVHQKCYQMPNVPDGDRTANGAVSPVRRTSTHPKCAFFPNDDGPSAAAMKLVVNGADGSALHRIPDPFQLGQKFGAPPATPY